MLNKDILLDVKGVSMYYRRQGLRSLRDMFSSLFKSKDEIERDHFWALKDIDLTIRRGDKVMLMGHNGAGKSTFLKLISRIVPPTKGEIILNGKINSLLQAGAGFHEELTGLDNIYFNGAMLKIPKKSIDERVEAVVEFSELGEFIDVPIKYYSSGMLSKLGFATAIYNLEADLIVLDEILSAGDVAFQKKSLNKMLSILMDNKRAVIYVGHDPPPKDVFNRGIVFHQGQKVFDGNFEEAYSFYLNKVGIEN